VSRKKRDTKGPYLQTEHYLIWRGFLANPGRMLTDLLSDDP